MEKIKIGILGIGGRGFAYCSVLRDTGFDVVAVCDLDKDFTQHRANLCTQIFGTPTAAYTNFDEFIEHEGLEAVFIANYFHEHATYAVRCLEKNIHVISECISNATMAEGVALVRAAEKSKAIYMLAENYPFMLFNQEMRRVYREGSLGKAIFCEGEYNHPIYWDEGTNRSLRPFAKHWRNHLPATYYVTHSLAPLMYITGGHPVRVSAMPAVNPVTEFEGDAYYAAERVGIITTLNDDNSVFRVMGWGQLGAEENSYRICGTKGQIENSRGFDAEDKVMLRYSSFDKPEGMKCDNFYKPEWPEDLRKFAEQAGHGGGDFFVMKEFGDCIREGRQPEFDVYFATTTASVAILGHRSLLEKGVPYDLPDFHKEEDRVKWENDTLSPFWGSDGTAPSIACSSVKDYKPNEEQFKRYLEMVGEE